MIHLRGFFSMDPSFRIGRWSSLHSTSSLFRTLLFVAFLTLRTSAFNVDMRTAVLHQGPNGSMFGYSLAMHRDKNFSWLLVGAPEAQTEQPNVVKGGAVFRCSIDSANMCQMIPFDAGGPSKIIIRGKKENMDDKSHQWFGATVHSSGENGAIVACAPRYVYFSSNLKRRDPVGTCWVVRASFQNFQEYSPCRTVNWGYHRQGYGQSGFSAAVTKNGRQLFIGAPGSWYWQGQLYSQDLLSKESLFSTPEGPEQEDDSYLGYSMAVGEFTGDRNPDVAVGVPRGNNLTGKVTLFNSTVHNLFNITGEQLGSYFGYSVCVADINGDRLDDVIIGAPLYSDLTSKDGSYEKGRIYVAYQTRKHNFRTRSQIDGTYSRGRFGLSVASVSDINRDGYGDIAVGCPYGGENGGGVVYIFHGGHSGINVKPSQVIFPSDIPSLGESTTFGFSVAGGMDLDNNQYPDLLIGAYESDAVAFLRSRPVIQATAHLKITPEKINLDDKSTTTSCKLHDDSIVPCVVVAFCLEYTGIGIPPTVGFVYNMILDAETQAPRVFFLTDENQNEQNISINLRKDSRYCKSIYVYLQRNVRDKLTPISVDVTYHVHDPHPDGIDLKPILNKNFPNNITKQVNIQKNCGQDNICIPDLKLQVIPNMQQFLIGSKKRLELNVILINAGEDAFESMLYVNMPVDVDYVNIGKVKPSDIHVSCGTNGEESEEKKLICDVGNPLPANTTMMFKVLLAPSKSLSASRDLQFVLKVNSTNEENEQTTLDNHVMIELPVRVEVNVTIHGISEPQVISYNRTETLPAEKTSETEAGPEVIHVYAVGNKGPSIIREAEVDILWPTYTLQGQPLLYLMDQPEIQGNGKCQEVSDVNPLFLKKEQKKPRSSGFTITIEALEAPLSINPTEVLEEEESSTQFLRKKRTLEGTSEESSAFLEEMSCGPTLCTKILCSVFNLTKDEQVYFTIRSRLWKNTLDEMGLDDVQISSKLVSRVTSLPHDVDPSYLGLKSYYVTTKVNPETITLQNDMVPWWILILSVSIGLLILGLLALVLWQLGFFRRRRIADQMQEPLHAYGNGYQLAKGDEYL